MAAPGNLHSTHGPCPVRPDWAAWLPSASRAPRSNKGISMELFTLFHVLISLVGIVSGFVVVFGMIGNRLLPGWTATFLYTTIATSVTGFMFPVRHFMPSHAFGIISLVVLPFTLVAYYKYLPLGKWRKTYVLTAVFALYLNTFVLVVQSFLKVPALHALAPNGNEPPFGIAQGVLLVLFVVLGIASVRRFHAAALAPLA
jgi:hypothetical protein